MVEGNGKGARRCFDTRTMPPFDSPVAAGGYQWWYLDAFDPASGQGLVVIAFIGSVFSPYYFRARQNSAEKLKADPLLHCALNIGLYGPRSKRWAMTERGGSSIEREASRFRLGPSHLQWRADGKLEIRFRERSAPTGRRLSGVIEVNPRITTDQCQFLDKTGNHAWSPWCPLADVEVRFDCPSVHWSGEGYLDSNRGSEPLEKAFRTWDWSRSRRPGGVEIQYDVTRTDGSQSAIMLNIDERGQAGIQPAPPPQPVRRSGWGIARTPRAEGELKLERTLEDTPFYARSLLRIEQPEGPVYAVHESLSLERFRKPWVRSLLPFRMPRKWWD